MLSGIRGSPELRSGHQYRSNGPACLPKAQLTSKGSKAMDTCTIPSLSTSLGKENKQDMLLCPLEQSGSI